MFHTLALKSSIVVTIVYWGFVSKKFEEKKQIDVFNIQRHVVNTVVILIDFSLVAIPVRLLHVVYCYTYGVVYTLATLIIYWIKETPSVYTFLNWHAKPSKAAFVAFIVAVATPSVSHSVFYFLFRMKLKLFVVG